VRSLPGRCQSITRLPTGIVRAARRCAREAVFPLFLSMAQRSFISHDLSDEPMDLGVSLRYRIALLIELNGSPHNEWFPL
jgi:hypothetical protein